MRERQQKSQVAEACAFQHGVCAAAPARRNQRAAPPRLKHSAAAKSRPTRARRKAAQKIRERAAHEKQHRHPERHESRDCEKREEQILDDAIAQNVELRAKRRGHIFLPREITVHAVQRDRCDCQKYRQRVHRERVTAQREKRHRGKGGRHSHHGNLIWRHSRLREAAAQIPKLPKNLAGPTASDVTAPHGSSMQARTLRNCTRAATCATRVNRAESVLYVCRRQTHRMRNCRRGAPLVALLRHVSPAASVTKVRARTARLWENPYLQS